MFRRRSSSRHQPLNTTPSASAQTAASRAFIASRNNDAALSSAAAAAALRSHTPTPTSVENVQSKRMLQRQLSNASRSSVATAPVRGGSLRRTPSSGSMTSRTFRDPSPRRPQTSSSETARRPPMPPVPQGLANVAKPGGIRRASSVQTPVTRVASPPTVLPGGRPTSLDRSSSPTVSPPSPRVVKNQHSNQNSLDLERPGSRTSINFSYPMNARPNSPPRSPVQQEVPRTSTEQTPNRSLSPVESVNIQQSVNNASSLKVKKKARTAAPGSTEGSHLAQKAMGGRPIGTAVQDTKQPDEPKVPQSPNRSVANDVTKQPSLAVDDRPQALVATVDSSDLAVVEDNVRSKPRKRPSIVMEDHSAEEQAESAEKAQHNNLAEAPSVQQHPLNGGVSEHAGQHLLEHPPEQLSIKPPQTKDQIVSTSPIRLSPSTSSTPSSPASDRHFADQTFEKQHPGRPSSISPNRSARFSNHLTVSSGSPIHEPPPRSMSPAKPALKMSSSPDRRLYTVIRSGQTPSEISDATSVASDDGSRTGSRKKTVKVGFDEGPEIVGVAASPPTSPEPVDTPPSPTERTKSRNWFSIAKKKLSLRDTNDDDFESVLKPRPALPSFGSIRGTREIDEPIMSVVPDDNESTSSSDDEFNHLSRSNDHAIGGILANASPPEKQSIDGADSQNREPAAVESQAHSTAKSGILEDIEEISPVQQQLPTVMEESDSNPSAVVTPVQTPTAALENPLTEANGDASLKDVPTIAIQPATPGGDNRSSLEIQIMPGGFPISSFERNTSTSSKVEFASNGVVATRTESSVPAAFDDDDDDSEESIYSDAAEAPDEFEDSKFGSIDAIVDSPLPPKIDTDKQTPDNSGPSRVSPVTTVPAPLAPLKSIPEVLAMESTNKPVGIQPQLSSTTKDTSTASIAEPLDQHKDTIPANTSKTARNDKSFDPFDSSWPLRSKDDPPVSSKSTVTKTNSSTSVDPHQGSHLRRALGENENRRANAQNRHSSPVVATMPISNRASSPPLSSTAASKQYGSVKTAKRPMSLTGSLISAKVDDSDSDSSFKRTRRSSKIVDGHYTMKRTMRATRPVSMATTAETTLGRSTSPRASSMRQTMRGPPPQRSSSGFGSLRNKTPGPRMRKSTTAPSLKSRIVDSDDDEDVGRNIFHSRFPDSSDDDEPLPSNLTPVRGIPRRRGELDRESTDLEDSSEEEGKKVDRNGTIKQASPMTPAEIDAILSQPRKRGGFLSRFASKSKDGKVRKSNLESAARRDTPLERSRLELAQIREEARTPRGNSPVSPKLHKRNTAEPTWPMAPAATIIPPSRDTATRPSTSDGLVNGANRNDERPTYERKPTLESLNSEPTAAVSDVVIGRNGRKKRFPLLRKAFGLRD